MPKIIWSDSFSVDNDEIDNQHRRWIEIFNQSYDKIMGNDYSLLSRIGIDALQQMRAYAKMHFRFEEQHLVNISYPDLEKHKRQHRVFEHQLDQINQDFENGVTKLNSEIMKLIENWLIMHIQREDQKYKVFIKHF